MNKRVGLIEAVLLMTLDAKIKVIVFFALDAISLMTDTIACCNERQCAL